MLSTFKALITFVGKAGGVTRSVLPRLPSTTTADVNLSQPPLFPGREQATQSFKISSNERHNKCKKRRACWGTKVFTHTYTIILFKRAPLTSQTMIND